MVTSNEPKRCYECDCGRITAFRDARSNQPVCTHCREDTPSVDDRAHDANETPIAELEPVSDDQDIYVAFKDVASFRKGTKSGLKKMDTVINNRQSRIDVSRLIRQHGMEDLKVRIRLLLHSGVFKDLSTASIMFPDLFRNKPAAKGTDSAEEAIEEAAPPEEAAPADGATSGREIA